MNIDFNSPHWCSHVGVELFFSAWGVNIPSLYSHITWTQLTSPMLLAWSIWSASHAVGAEGLWSKRPPFTHSGPLCLFWPRHHTNHDCWGDSHAQPVAPSQGCRCDNVRDGQSSVCSDIYGLSAHVWAESRECKAPGDVCVNLWVKSFQGTYTSFLFKHTSAIFQEVPLMWIRALAEQDVSTLLWLVWWRLDSSEQVH